MAKNEVENEMPKKLIDELGESNSELFEQLAELTLKFAEMEKKEQRQELQASFAKKLIEKKIPVSFARGRVINREEDIETNLTEAEAEYQKSRK